MSFSEQKDVVDCDPPEILYHKVPETPKVKRRKLVDHLLKPPVTKHRRPANLQHIKAAIIQAWQRTLHHSSSYDSGEARAAAVIQHAYKNYCNRLRLLQWQEWIRKNDAAIVIGRYFRGYRTRRMLRTSPQPAFLPALKDTSDCTTFLKEGVFPALSEALGDLLRAHAAWLAASAQRDASLARFREEVALKRSMRSISHVEDDEDQDEELLFPPIPPLRPLSYLADALLCHRDQAVEAGTQREHPGGASPAFTSSRAD